MRLPLALEKENIQVKTITAFMAVFAYIGVSLTGSYFLLNLFKYGNKPETVFSWPKREVTPVPTKKPTYKDLVASASAQEKVSTPTPLPSIQVAQVKPSASPTPAPTTATATVSPRTQPQTPPPQRPKTYVSYVVEEVVEEDTSEQEVRREEPKEIKPKEEEKEQVHETPRYIYTHSQSSSSSDDSNQDQRDDDEQSLLPGKVESVGKKVGRAVKELVKGREDKKKLDDS